MMLKKFQNILHRLCLLIKLAYSCVLCAVNFLRIVCVYSYITILNVPIALYRWVKIVFTLENTGKFLHYIYKNLLKHSYDLIFIDQDGVKEKTINSDMQWHIKSTKKHIILGFGLIFLLSFVIKIDSAVTANGTFTPSSRKKIIQHLEGGIIEKVLVSEGDLVTKGQVLIKLNEAKSNADHVIKQHNYHSKEIEKLRILAEINDEEDFTPGAELQKIIQSDNKLEIFYNQEKYKLRNNVSVLKSKLDILESKKLQNNEQIKGLVEQIEYIRKRITTLEDEKRVWEDLRKKQLADHDRMLSIQQNILMLRGDLSNKQSSYQALLNHNKEIDFQISLAKETNTKELEDYLQEVNTSLQSLQSQLVVSSDIFDRTAIKSTVDGIVTMVNINGEGQVVNQNNDIMEIVPINDDLIIEAKVDPQNISIVNIGLSAKVMPIFPNRRLAPPVFGEVVHVSHDAKTDSRGYSYFIVKIRFKAGELDRVYKSKILPGMYAHVFIRTGERNLITYIFEPLLFSIMMAGNEM